MYDFLRHASVGYIQFPPIVERLAGTGDAAIGLDLHGPGSETGAQERLTDWSVLPEDYDRFLTTVFDHWVRNDIGKVFVMNFEWALANFFGP